MGKVKKLRKKYHLNLKKSKFTCSLREEKLPEERIPEDNFLTKNNENIFAGVDISWDNLIKSLPQDFDIRSVLSTKSRKELKEDERHLKKKEKQKLRQERFMQKLNVAHQLMNKSKTKKTKEKKTLYGDMTSLLNALPSLESFEENRPDEKLGKSKTKTKGILKAKQRLKQQAVDAKIFKKILDDKKFKENPLQAVTQYLKHKIIVQT